jgi:thiamine pyrophosphate-dependent acetolactate synthase large subunit-like protein
VESYEVEVRDDGFVWVGVPRETPRVRTASDVLAETLVAYGVRDVFGMVGHSNLGMADALRECEEAGTLRFVGIRHEGAAAFAASAYGKLLGRPAACLTIAGPGATNLLTGLWDAHLDGAPVVALTGQVDSSVRGLGAFQDVDLGAAFGGVAAWTAELGAGRASELAAQAVRHAVHRRGVSHLVLPDEAQVAESSEPAGSPSGRLAVPAMAPASLDAAVDVLRDARRPVIIAGHGAREGRAAVRALAEHLGAPIVTTFKAKGLVGDDHPLAGGVLGRSGTPVASWVMNEADALIVLGASFSNHTGIYAGHPTVHVDDRLDRLGDRHGVAAPVHGDVGVVCSMLLAALPGAAARDDQAADLRERWAIWHAEKASRVRDDRGHGVASAAVFAALSVAAPEDAVICVDVGNHAYSFGRYFESAAGQDVLMSGYLGSIGFALPAALGASAAVRGTGRRVIAVCGDGGFGQYGMELTTAVRYGMPITVVLLDNGQLGKISKEQRAGEWDVWQTGLTNPDFAAFARLCGASGESVEDTAGVFPALERALSMEGPSLVAIRSDPELV